jgi:hypothetical protein
VERERKRAAAAEEAMHALKDKASSLQRQADAAKRELADAVAAARQEAQAAAAVAQQQLQSNLEALQQELQRLREKEGQAVSQPGTPALRGGVGAAGDKGDDQARQLLQQKEEELQAALARVAEAEAAAGAAHEAAAKDRECVMQVQVGCVTPNHSTTVHQVFCICSSSCHPCACSNKSNVVTSDHS